MIFTFILGYIDQVFVVISIKMYNGSNAEITVLFNSNGLPLSNLPCCILIVHGANQMFVLLLYLYPSIHLTAY